MGNINHRVLSVSADCINVSKHQIETEFYPLYSYNKMKAGTKLGVCVHTGIKCVEENYRKYRGWSRVYYRLGYKINMDVCSIALTILYIFIHFPHMSKLLCSNFTLTDTVNLQKVGRMLMHTHYLRCMTVCSVWYFQSLCVCVYYETSLV